MKLKLSILAIATALTSISAVAGVTGFTTYDYDRANSGQGPWGSQHEIHVGASAKTKLGTFDGAWVARQLVTNSRDDNSGFELGYGGTIKLGKVDIAGRAAYGRVNLVDTTGGGFIGNSEYYSLGAEAQTQLNATFRGFAGYRYRGNLNSGTPNQNRFTVGVDFPIAKGFSGRAGYAFTKQGGSNFNGLTTAVSYAF